MIKKLIIPWLIHLYTASGAIIAFLTIKAALEQDIQIALLLIFIAIIIDGTDGMLARYFAVKKNIPHFDGTTLDNITDYLTYVFSPLLLLWITEKIPNTSIGILIISLILLASSYQFCQTNAKTKDNFFIGFPDYWNLIAFYALTMIIPTPAFLFILISGVILSFIPIKYIYPSRTKPFKLLTLSLTALWILLCMGALFSPSPEIKKTLITLSLVYPVYYFITSAYLNIKSSG